MTIAATKPGQIIAGRYELTEVAGRGGMATVWKARVIGAHGFSRWVAVKQMHGHLAEQSAFVDMFVEEARVGAELQDSPHVAQVQDFVAENGNYNLVMEWISGVDLGTYVRYFTEHRGGTRWKLCAFIGMGVLRGLSSAHGDGKRKPIVHRDVSPHNILLTESGGVKLIDFGLCLAHDRRSRGTEPGIVKGKMAYLSPEIVQGDRPSPHSDQFAAGSVMWESLVGRQLFEGATDLDIYKKLKLGQIQPLKPQRPDVPNKLSGIIQRALARDPAKRFASTSDMSHAIAVFLQRGKTREELEAHLGKTVREVMAAGDLAVRVDESSAATPVADLSSELKTQEAEEPKRRGLRHWLPFFGRKG